MKGGQHDHGRSGPAIFEADPADEFRLTFTVPDATMAGGQRALMTMRCFEEQKLRGAIVWLGEHQDLWPEWREIAEADGGNVLSGHLVSIMKEESLALFGSADFLYEACLGATATRGKGRTEIMLSLTLSTRSLPIITHAFRNVRSRNAFMNYLMAADQTLGSVELAELALLEGRGALARKLDSIARARTSATGETVH